MCKHIRPWEWRVHIAMLRSGLEALNKFMRAYSPPREGINILDESEIEAGRNFKIGRIWHRRGDSPPRRGGVDAP